MKIEVGTCGMGCHSYQKVQEAVASGRIDVGIFMEGSFGQMCKVWLKQGLKEEFLKILPECTKIAFNDQELNIPIDIRKVMRLLSERGVQFTTNEEF